jgi:hypothetical protein
MKLAEALILRADQHKRLEQLKQRLLTNAKVQEGDAPAEDPAALLAEFERIAEAFETSIRTINRTNTTTRLDDSMTLTDALARRDVLRARHAAYRALAEAAVSTGGRYSRSEIKMVSTVNVADMQRRADELARAYRDLDTRIQEANWRVDLLE